MSRQFGCAMLVMALAAPALAQRDPWAGSWRGALTTPEGDDTNVTITLVAENDGYTGLVTGSGSRSPRASRRETPPRANAPPA